jgi:hypothetical protein
LSILGTSHFPSATPDHTGKAASKRAMDPEEIIGLLLLGAFAGAAVFILGAYVL